MDWFVVMRGGIELGKGKAEEGTWGECSLLFEPITGTWGNSPDP